ITNSDGAFLNEIGKTAIARNLLYSNNATPLEFELAIVHGNFTADSNSGEVSLFDAFVDGNATLTNNTGGVFLGSTAIGGTLNCASNDPAPDLPFGDSAAKAHGQCSSLESGAYA